MVGTDVSEVEGLRVGKENPMGTGCFPDGTKEGTTVGPADGFQVGLKLLGFLLGL